MLHHIVSRWMF